MRPSRHQRRAPSISSSTLQPSFLPPFACGQSHGPHLSLLLHAGRRDIAAAARRRREVACEAAGRELVVHASLLPACPLPRSPCCGLSAGSVARHEPPPAARLEGLWLVGLCRVDLALDNNGIWHQIRRRRKKIEADLLLNRTKLGVGLRID